MKTYRLLGFVAPSVPLQTVAFIFDFCSRTLVNILPITMLNEKNTNTHEYVSHFHA